MNKTSSIFKNIILLGLGNFGTKIVSLLLVPLYTAYLSTTDYGALDLINTISILKIGEIDFTLNLFWYK